MPDWTFPIYSKGSPVFSGSVKNKDFQVTLPGVDPKHKFVDALTEELEREGGVEKGSYLTFESQKYHGPTLLFSEGQPHNTDGKPHSTGELQELISNWCYLNQRLLE